MTLIRIVLTRWLWHCTELSLVNGLPLFYSMCFGLLIILRESILFNILAKTLTDHSTHTSHSGYFQRRSKIPSKRTVDFYSQILCRFQKSKQKVPPPSLPCTKKIKRSFFSNKCFFPEIFFFRHFSKSCSVFYIL